MENDKENNSTKSLDTLEGDETPVYDYGQRLKNYQRQREETFIKVNKAIKKLNSKLVIDGKTVRDLRRDVENVRADCRKVLFNFYKNNKQYRQKYTKPTPYDSTSLLRYFPCLRLKKGFCMDAYYVGQPEDGAAGGGKGHVLVLPEGYKLTIPKSEESDILLASYFMGIEEEMLNPLPEWAREDIESFLEGDGSPLSYFQASMFSRDIRELGAVWHDLYWCMNTVLTTFDQIPKDQEWTWDVSMPDNWLPFVWQDDDNQWNVTFYTYDSMEAKIIFHNDTYLSGYDFKYSRFNIASSPHSKQF